MQVKQPIWSVSNPITYEDNSKDHRQIPCLAKQTFLADLKLHTDRPNTGIILISKEEIKIYLNQTSQQMNGEIVHLLRKTTKETKEAVIKIYSLPISQITIEEGKMQQVICLPPRQQVVMMGLLYLQAIPQITLLHSHLCIIVETIAIRVQLELVDF